MRILMVFLMLWGSAGVESQAQGSGNYVKQTTLLVPGVTSTDDLDNRTVDQKNVTTTYIDGLGRISQYVSWQISPAKKDMVQPVTYDPYSREAVKYLPYVSNNASGAYEQNPVGYTNTYSQSPQFAFYNKPDDAIADDPKPYTQTIFERSPLNRVLKQGAPGAVWQPHTDPSFTADNTVKHRYEYNDANEVLLFTYDQATELIDFKENDNLRFYSPNQLYANKTIDEHGNEIIEYVDKENRTVLKKVQYRTENGVKLYADTYYIYDDFGNIVVVLPPEGVKALLGN